MSYNENTAPKPNESGVSCLLRVQPREQEAGAHSTVEAYAKAHQPPPAFVPGRRNAPRGLDEQFDPASVAGHDAPLIGERAATQRAWRNGVWRWSTAV
jgi:hypothetical protein